MRLYSAKNSEGTVEQNVQVGRKVDDTEYEDYDEDPDDELNECKYNPITKVACFIFFIESQL